MKRHANRAALLLFGVGLLTWLVIGSGLLLDLTKPSPLSPTPPPGIALRPTQVPTVTVMPNTPTSTPTTTPDPTETPRPSPTHTTIPTLEAVITATFVTAAASPNPTSAPTQTIQLSCAPPNGWVSYAIQDGDTLFGFQLGSQNALTVEAIMQANCLKSKLLSVGQSIYLPPGVADNAPKIDNGPAEGPSLPAGLSRAAHCPCTITVRAGWRLEQIAATIDKTPVGFTGRDFIATVSASAPTPPFGFLSSKPGGVSLEGFLFPGTYTLDNTTSAVQFRDKLLAAFDSAITPQMRQDAGARGLNLYQVVVLASIVQRESYYTHEQKLIASVFYNRMAANKGIASTVTLQYALGHAGNWWPRVVGAQVNLKSPYNTNIRLGLPPSAISSPDLDALTSTIYPAQTDFQFFAKACNAPGNFYTQTWEQFEQGLRCGS